MWSVPGREVRHVSYMCAKSALYVLIEKTKIAENQTINSYLQCPEQKQPNERICKNMEVGSSFGKIDKYLYISMLQKLNCKNRCHSLSGNIAKNHIGGQSGDKNLGQNLERNYFICSFVYRQIKC